MKRGKCKIDGTSTIISDEEFNEFLSASEERKWNILLVHAERNKNHLREIGKAYKAEADQDDSGN